MAASVIFENQTVSVPDEYQDLALAVLKCGIGLLQIELVEEENEKLMMLTFPSFSDCERFVDVILNRGEDSLVSQLFNDSNCLHGFFTIDKIDEPGDKSYDSCSISYLRLPIFVRDGVTPVFNDLAQLIEAEVDYCDMVDKSSPTIPQSEWDGGIVSAIQGVDDLKSGQLVKIAFHARHPAHITERLWVKVRNINDIEIDGCVNSRPMALTNVKYGQPVSFERYHILEVCEYEDISNTHTLN